MRVPIQRLELAGLRTIVVGPDDATLAVILMHGFGAGGDDLVSLAGYLGVHARFVFPEAPIELGGMYGAGRAWWRLDLEKLELALRTGKVRERIAEIPDGLAEARAQVSRLVDDVHARYATDDAHVVLGGFSQGAMLALDVALHRERPPAGVALLSGTLVAEPEWAPRLPRLAGVPIFQSHGRHDPLLRFTIAEELRDKLVAAGARVDWHEFFGGHEIPPDVLDELGTFLRAKLG